MRILAIDPGPEESAMRGVRTAEESERVRGYERAYRARHPERIKERERLRRERDRETLRARDRARYAADPEKYREKTRLRQKRNPVSIRNAQRRYLYGLTPEAFEALFESQGRVCAICRTADFGKRGPHVDHDHGSRHVRGILCDPCNRGLGVFRDNPANLQRAANYLKRAWK